MSPNQQSVAILPLINGETNETFERDLANQLGDIAITSMGSVGSELPYQQWIAVVCKRISESGAAFQGLHLIAFGDAVERLPDIAFAQRAARRTVHSYIVVDHIPQQPRAEWPDAPVTLILTNPRGTINHSAKLRGWDVIQLQEQDNLVDVIAQTLQLHLM